MEQSLLRSSTILLEENSDFFLDSRRFWTTVCISVAGRHSEKLMRQSPNLLSVTKVWMPDFNTKEAVWLPQEHQLFKRTEVTTRYLQMFTKKNKDILSCEERLGEEAVLGAFSTAESTGRKSVVVKVMWNIPPRAKGDVRPTSKPAVTKGEWVAPLLIKPALFCSNLWQQNLIASPKSGTQILSLQTSFQIWNKFIIFHSELSIQTEH